MKYINRLSRRLAGKRLKWIIFPFPYLLYVSLIIVLGFSFMVISFVIFFKGLHVETISAYISSIIVTLCWLIILIYTSYMSWQKNLRIIIAIPATVFFVICSTYLFIFSPDFFVDFIACLFLLYLPLTCLFTILMLIVYDLTPYLFGMVYLKTTTFAKPVKPDT